MKFIRKYLLVLLALVLPPELHAEQFQCRPYRLAESAEAVTPEKFSRGLLWEISQHDRINGYIFGTIHVDDPDILDLPDAISDRLANSAHYVMEMLPADDDIQKFTGAMFFQDDQRLDQMLGPDTYARTVEILREYGMTPEVVPMLQPWAAFVLMSYPDNMDTVLDMKLLELAQRNNVSVSGMETIDEQINVFSSMKVTAQTRILTDTVCHYETTAEDFDAMKALYLERDLQGLVAYSHRYRFDDNSVYDEVYDRLIIQRNRRMVERMEAMLAKGSVFIAVGAMHLPGKDGILSLLENRDYTVTRVY